jgi:hypothetical protein
MVGSYFYAWAAFLCVGCAVGFEPSQDSTSPLVTDKVVLPPDLGHGASGSGSEVTNWQGPVLLGSAGSAQVPSAVSWAAGRLDVFGAALQPGGVFELAHWWYDRAWHGPDLHGGNMGGDPCAISRADGQLDVFAVDGSSSQEMVAHWGFDGSWDGPTLLPGATANARMVAAPSVVSSGGDQLDVFAVQSLRGDPDIVSFSYTDRWRGPVGLPGRSNGSTSAPVAVSWGPGRLDLFATDIGTGQLVHWWFDEIWDGPAFLGGSLIPDAPLSVVSSQKGRLDVFGAAGLGGAFAVGSELAHWWYDGNWHGPELLGGNIANNPSGPSAVSWGEGRLDVFATDADTGQLVHWWSDEGWHGPELLGGNPRSSPNAVSEAPGSLDVFAFDLDSDQLAWWSRRPDHPILSRKVISKALTTSPRAMALGVAGAS